MHCKQFFSLSVASLLLAAALTGCGAASSTASSAASSEAASSVASSAAASETAAAALPDGVYTAEFDTDSGMFHANEACDGKGTLTVENGKMTFHVSLASKKIVNLYVGMAADADANKADWLLPTTDNAGFDVFFGEKEPKRGYTLFFFSSIVYSLVLVLLLCRAISTDIIRFRSMRNCFLQLRAAHIAATPLPYPGRMRRKRFFL